MDLQCRYLEANSRWIHFVHKISISVNLEANALVGFFVSFFLTGEVALFLGKIYKKKKTLIL